MLDYTQTFEQFAGSVKPLDLALYAGVGLVVWVLFKDKLNPVVTPLINNIKNIISGYSATKTIGNNTNTTIENKVSLKDNEDVFFQLVVSWKQTRDLAVKSGCVEAVKVADQMFPYLSPEVCSKGS